MAWVDDLSYLFGGLFLVNAIPHVVSGVMGRPFRSPFAKPPGKGLPSAKVNVLWGAFNVLVGYALMFCVGTFNPRSTGDALAFGAGALLGGLLLAQVFGKLHGGQTPDRS